MKRASVESDSRPRGNDYGFAMVSFLGYDALGSIATPNSLHVRKSEIDPPRI